MQHTRTHNKRTKKRRKKRFRKQTPITRSHFIVVNLLISSQQEMLKQAHVYHMKMQKVSANKKNQTQTQNRTRTPTKDRVHPTGRKKRRYKNNMAHDNVK
jgi:hypothetical protein